MYLSNMDVFRSPYVVIDEKCDEIPFVVWADENKKEYCVWVIKNNQVLRNDFGYPQNKIVKNKNFKIINIDDFREINWKNKVIDKIKSKQGV